MPMVCANVRMEWLQAMHSEVWLRQVVADLGLAVLVLIVFAETGLLAGFFLPGDSMLVTAGILTVGTPGGDAPLGLGTTMAALVLAAIAGNEVGRRLGARLGDGIRGRPDGWFFKRRHLADAEAYYAEKGALSLVLARFVPILRTFVPFVAGMGRMDARRFLLWNVIGAVLWVPSLLTLGHCIGRTPLAEKLHEVILVVIALSFLPIVLGALRRWVTGRRG